MITSNGNVNDLLTPLFLTLEQLFLTLDPPNYSNGSEKIQNDIHKTEEHPRVFKKLNKKPLGKPA